MPDVHVGLYKGIVLTNNDTQRRGRVQIAIPGLTEREWADVVMLGSPYNNGAFAVPTQGAEVLVGFLNGDIHSPVVFGGFVPPVIAGSSRVLLDTDVLPKITRFENDDWVLMMGKKGTDYPYISIYSRENDETDATNRETKRMSFIMDLESGAVEINSPVSLKIKSKGVLKLEGSAVKINDRVVSQTEDPI
jgi:hypothetical protein